MDETPRPGREIIPPGATYRLQLHPGFGFDEAAELAPYLAELGVTHLYASPYLQAAESSTHGYDVVDHHRVSRELGGPEAHGRLDTEHKPGGEVQDGSPYRQGEHSAGHLSLQSRSCH